MKVLIVDDSVVMRSQIKSSLDGIEFIEVVGTANNGKIALQKLEQTTADAIILDMEMPELNGIETIKIIRQKKIPIRILVFSAHTSSGSSATLEALSAGADDFIAKPSGPDLSIENAVEKIREQILPKLKQFIKLDEGFSKNKILNQETNFNSTINKTYPKKDLSVFLPAVLVIGSSTGGPPALEEVLKNLLKPLRIPIVIAQHMPPIFTASLARRLQEITGITCSEAKNNEQLLPNKIYIAPGDFHLTLYKENGMVFTKLDQTLPRNSVRPSVDPLFETASKIYGPQTLAIVLTGMGEDGLVGSKAVKENSGGVLIQNKESCVVFGMPGAIFDAKIHDDMGDLQHINRIIKRVVT